MTQTSRALRSRGAAAFAVVALLLTACDAGSSDADGDAGADDTAAGTPSSDVAATVSVNVKRGAVDVPVSTLVKVGAKDGTLDSVKVTSAEGPLPGEVSTDGSQWAAGDRLEPGVTYTVKAVASSAGGDKTRTTSRFTTQELSLDQQTYPSVAPLDGETVGVGMPVVVNFDVAVTDRASVEKNLTVTSTPAQTGSWRWVSDNEVHWRPKEYWKPGTEVSVDADINGVDAGGGIYGQEDRAIDFTIGDAHVYKVNAQTHQMKVFSNGKLVNTFPITTGKAGFTTRSGTKVIMEKFDSKRMNSETVGIPQGSAEAYDINNVQWAMRLTSSGEFIHAAPWSVGSQGYANVSHGCTGMSTADASWLYDMTVRGDVVEYTGTDRPMETDNGYGDWNLSFADYKAGSAL